MTFRRPFALVPISRMKDRFWPRPVVRCCAAMRLLSGNTGRSTGMIGTA